MAENTEIYTIKKTSQLHNIWKRLRKNKTAMIGLVILSIFVFFLIFGDLISDYENLAIKQDISLSLQKPSAEHWFGTDFFGRDIFARIVFGTRISLVYGLIIITLSMSCGIFLGSIAGYYGGKIDNLLMRFLDAISAIPAMLLTLCFVAALGPGMGNLVIAVVIADIPHSTRLVRSSIISVSDNEYIEAAIACGTRAPRIILRHILPNALGPIIVQATMGLGFVIINIAGLSFLGMGVQPPTPEWGYMLSEGREFMRNAPWVVIFPGLAIMLTALSFNLLGDGLRDAIDPRLKK